MAITIVREGYGFVEPNFLSAPRNGQVRADLPVGKAAAETISNSVDKALMNGMFVKRDAVKGEVNFTGKGAWWLVFNEEKLYDENKQMHRHFAMKAEDNYDGKMVPRIFFPAIGDTFTTNTFAANTVLEVGDYVVPGVNGILAKTDSESFLQVVKCYTMPDGQPGVKLEVVANQ